MSDHFYGHIVFADHFPFSDIDSSEGFMLSFSSYYLQLISYLNHIMLPQDFFWALKLHILGEYYTCLDKNPYTRSMS